MSAKIVDVSQASKKGSNDLAIAKTDHSIAYVLNVLKQISISDEFCVRTGYAPSAKTFKVNKPSDTLPRAEKDLSSLPCRIGRKYLNLELCKINKAGNGSIEKTGSFLVVEFVSSAHYRERYKCKIHEAIEGVEEYRRCALAEKKFEVHGGQDLYRQICEISDGYYVQIFFLDNENKQEDRGVEIMKDHPSVCEVYRPSGRNQRLIETFNKLSFRLFERYIKETNG